MAVVDGKYWRVAVVDSGCRRLSVVDDKCRKLVVNDGVVDGGGCLRILVADVGC